MAEIDYNNFEIVGLNGAVSLQVQFARTLPIGHTKGRDNYFLAERQFHEQGVDHHSVAKYGLEEIRGFQQEGRLVLLASPFPMIKDAVILYTATQALTSSGLNQGTEPVTTFNGRTLSWQHLQDRDVWVTCSDEETIGKLLGKLKNK